MIKFSSYYYLRIKWFKLIIEISQNFIEQLNPELSLFSFCGMRSIIVISFSVSFINYKSYIDMWNGDWKAFYDGVIRNRITLTNCKLVPTITVGCQNESKVLFQI